MFTMQISPPPELPITCTRAWLHSGRALVFVVLPRSPLPYWAFLVNSAKATPYAFLTLVNVAIDPI